MWLTVLKLILFCCSVVEHVAPIVCWRGWVVAARVLLLVVDWCIITLVKKVRVEVLGFCVEMDVLEMRFKVDASFLLRPVPPDVLDKHVSCRTEPDQLLGMKHVNIPCDAAVEGE
jgi:hypothetical protein